MQFGVYQSVSVQLFKVIKYTKTSKVLKIFGSDS